MGTWTPGPEPTDGNDQFIGDNTGEIATGLGGADTLTGNGGADILEGGDGDDQIFGGDADDTLVGGAGADIINGGFGERDWTSYESSAGVLIDLNAGAASGGDADGDTISNIENVIGSAQNDTLTGSALNNILIGGNGDDALSGGGGDDRLEGQDGADAIDGDDGDDVIGDGFGTGPDVLAGGDGIDTLDYSGNVGAVQVNLATNVVSGGAAEGDTISGFENATGSVLADTLVGTAGANVLRGGAAANSLSGGDGDDVLMDTDGGDTMDGGAGSDTADFSERVFSGVLNANLATGAVTVGGIATTLISIENIRGTGGSDTIIGDSGANTIWGGVGPFGGAGGNDSLQGGGGDDILYGEGGNDTLLGGGGADNMTGGVGADFFDGGADVDWIFYSASDQAVVVDLTAGTGSGGHAAGDTFSNVENVMGSNFVDTLIGNDVANSLAGGAGGDTLNGGGGGDFANYANATAGVVASLITPASNTGDAAGDIYISIEHLTGSNFVDTLTGDNDANQIDGGNGADTLNGEGGDDVLMGGSGADTFNGGDGNDIYVVDDAGDTVTENGNQGADTVQAGINYTLGANVENLTLTGSATTGTGNALANVITGGSLADTLNGGDGADTLSGMGGGDTLNGGDGDDILYGHSANAPGGISAVAISTGIAGSPAAGAATAADPGFLYIVSKDTGVISRVDAATGARTTFLDIPNGEFLGSGERGVLGLAFHPDYAANGRFFVYLTDAQGDLQIREYHRSAGDPTVADAGFTIVIEIPKQTGFSNHNGGWIGFSPEDGYLYIATGDGGGSGDPGNNAQDLNDLLGKIIRIDVNSDDFPGDANRNYHVPNDNPFVGVDGLDEIWAYGVRNPWRLAFDPRNGDLYIADVGQGAREEVNFQAGGSAGGQNYGWRIMEGSLPFAPGGPGTPQPGDPSLILPVHEYGRTLGASITGGEVYVGPNGGMTGHYVFADFVSGRIFSLYMNDGVAVNVAERTLQMTGANLSSITDFVTGTDGNLYAIGIGGTVWRLDFANGAEDVGDTLDGGAGDDQLFGGVGDDVLIGGIGTDTIDGGIGNDTITYAMGDGGGTIDGGAGTDTLNVTDGLATSTLNVTYDGSAITVLAGNTLTSVETINVNLGGGGEIDRLIYATTAAITVNLATNTATGLASAMGIEYVTSGSGNDSLTGNASNNRLDGGAGNDVLSGGLGNDILVGGDGDDILNGGGLGDNISGGAGNDTINNVYGDFGASSPDTIDGGADIDTFNVTQLSPSADMTINVGFNGTALISMNSSSLANIEIVNVDISGGIGQDTLSYTVASAAVNVDMGAGIYSGFNTLIGIERVIGGGGGDTITGNNLANALFGQGGNDNVNGGGGVDQVSGGDGADTLSGGAGNDSIFGDAGNDTINWGVADGRDTVNGGADFDTFVVTGSVAAELGQVTWNGTTLTAVMNNGLTNVEAVSLNLGGGIDWLIYTTSSAVVVNLAAGTGSGLSSISGVEKVIGGSGSDTLTGDGLDNRLDGQGGADTLNGGAGSDTVLGGDGDDIINASAGNDSLQGQNGADTFNWTAADGRDTFNGGADVDTVNLAGSDFADDVADANWNGSAITGLLNNALIDIETINLDLGAGNLAGDWLRYNTTVGVTVNLTTGTGTGFASIAGVENLIGGVGGDTLTGDANANKINGNNGDDIITGGGGADNLTGAAGSDTFVYAAGAGNDTINDFDAWAVGGQDFIDVAAFGINAGNFATRVAIIDTGADTVIRIDDTYFITLKNVSGDGDNVITQSDFIFGP